jgi:hypothetical protein
VSKQIPFFAGPADDAALQHFIQLQGLHIVPLRADLDLAVLADPRSHPLCYISLVPRERLSPDRGTPPCVNYVQNPLIQFIRSYHVSPYLVAGRIWWPGPQGYGKLTKRAFATIASWIRERWGQREADGFYIGPDALRMEREEGAQLVYLPPDVSVRIVPVS